jgi:osmotically-inducible protein OsmY
MTHSKHMNRAALALLMALGALSVACGKRDTSASVGERVDATVAEAQSDAREAGEAAKARLDETRSAVSDAAITAEVNAKIAQDKELEATKIDVKVSNGVVVLQGTAPSDAAVSRAVALAQGTSGVTSVTSELKVVGS